MNIAILSGKGGTGKTTLSTNLALALSANYIDCDVEEPNGFLFLNPIVKKSSTVFIDYPFIDDALCDSCGKCTEVCQFNALAKVNNDIVLFDKLCHGCSSCKLICDKNAIVYKKRKIGIIEEGFKDSISCFRGVLDISEPMAVPVIKELLNGLPKGLNIIDCPPGTSCNVVNALKFSDFAILITEPSKFGLHDLDIAVQVVKMFDLKFGVIINKEYSKENIIRDYCIKNNIEILGSIPYNKEIAVNYSNGNILYENNLFKPIFDNLSDSIRECFKWN